jgi:hypothetical protein
VPHPGVPRSARHSRVGCPGAHEAEALPSTPVGIASPSVGAAALPPMDGRSPHPPIHEAAALTLFEGQAMFVRLPGRLAPLGKIAWFRFPRRSRTIRLAEPRR